MTLPVTDLIVQRLLEFDPTYDVGSGAASTGFLIEPLSIILQPIVDELTVLQATGSVLTILEAADPDSFPQDIVDAIASNVFVQREPGDTGSTVERVRFFAPQDFSAAQGLLIFLGPSGQRYTNSAPVQITQAEMALNADGTLFFVDIPIVALDQGTAFNVDPGTILGMEAQPTTVANVTNLFKVDTGLDQETNTELIDRIKVAVTVRALVTGRGIIVTLTENFTTIVEIQPVGFGEPEMMRDIVYNVHIGGDVDVWVKTPALDDGQRDIFSLQLDTTRRRSTSSTVVALQSSVPYSLSRASIDRTTNIPVVTTIDGGVSYTEGVDYTLDDLLGTLTRLPGGRIFHIQELGGAGTITTSKRLQHSSPTFFENVRAGMILTVLGPNSVAGRYTIKAQLSANLIEIFGTFPGPTPPVTNVNFQIDDLLLVGFDYNPVSIDIDQAARTPARDSLTITDVPFMLLESIEQLDPLTLQSTGVFLSPTGGYGAGPFGRGPYGIGHDAQYRLQIAQPTLRFSVREDNYIEFDQSLIGASVRVTYKFDPAIAPLQAFCDDPQNQTEAASLLVRHFVPIYIDSIIPIAYSIPTSTQATALTSDQMAAVLAQFINNISGGGVLELSDLVDVLYNNGANEVDIEPLRELRGAIHNEDGTVQFITPDLRGIMAIPSDPIPDPTTRPLSPKIARFLSNNLTLVRSLA